MPNDKPPLSAQLDDLADQAMGEDSRDLLKRAAERLRQLESRASVSQDSDSTCYGSATDGALKSDDAVRPESDPPR